MILFKVIKRNLSGFAGKLSGILFLLFTLNGSFVYSQTLDNEIIRIKYVCIDASTGDIVIGWEKSNFPGIVNYTVSYLQPQDLNPMPNWIKIPGISVNATDSVVRFSPDLLEEVDVNEAPVSFAIQAHDASDIRSDVDNLPWDSSMVLKATYDSCLSEVILNWSSYDFNMWDYNDQAYRIYVSENGGPFILNSSVVNANSYTINNLQPNSNYSLFIAAIPESPGLSSDSSTSILANIDTRRALHPQYVYADYATISGNNADVKFSIDPQGQLTKYNLLRSKSPTGTFDIIIQLEPQNNTVTYIDKIDFLAGPYYYKLEAINYCDVAVVSSENIASTIVLQNSGDPLTPVLNWNAYENWINGVDHYNIERKFGNDPYQAITETSATTYTDAEIQNLTGTGIDASVCYRLTAHEQNNPLANNNSSISNEVCFELPINIVFNYDAFMPGSGTDNDKYGPVIDFIPDDFIFEILDRTGRVVYRSTNPLDCEWDGKIIDTHTLALSGAYMYVLQYQNRGGKKHVLRGGVVVVYP